MLFTYMYLLRVPFALGLFLASFAPLALYKSSQVTTLLEGMFDLNWPRIAVATVTSLLAGTAFTLCTEIVLRYGHLRFGVGELSPWLRTVKSRNWGLEITRFTILNIVFYLVCVVPMLGGLVYAGRGSLLERVSGVLLGLLCFAVLLVIAVWIWATSPPTVARYLGTFFLWTPAGYIQTDKQKQQTLAALPEGEVLQKHRENALLLGGHGFVAAAFGVTLFFYIVLGVARWLEINWLAEHGSSASSLPLVPTVACIALLLTLVGYLLSAMTFLLDRFRVPILLPVAALALAQGNWPQADHFFPSLESGNAERIRVSPSEVLNQGGDAAVVVATSGGGIQAAAWTTTVLSRLQLEMPGDLARSIRVVSSVSGGSVGTVYYLAAFEDGTLDKTKIRQRVFDPSTGSVLDDVAWGVVYPDFLRLFFPFEGTVDRGWAAEKGWLRYGKLGAGLSTWRPLTKQGKLPAVILNATTSETGGRFLISTTDFDSHAKGRESFYDLYQDSDIPIVTAARLSASFPYVSPAARINACIPRSRAYHFVDGGYYDNYGIASLIDWLNEATEKQHSVKHILILQIRGPVALEDPKATGQGGLLYQLAAPLSTLLNFRSEGQISHNDAELGLFIEAARQRNIGVETAIFQYPRPDTPLSWHLTPSEIKDVWEQYDHCDASFRTWDLCRNRQHVKDFISGIYEDKGIK